MWNSDYYAVQIHVVHWDSESLRCHNNDDSEVWYKLSVDVDLLLLKTTQASRKLLSLLFWCYALASSARWREGLTLLTDITVWALGNHFSGGYIVIVFNILKINLGVLDLFI